MVAVSLLGGTTSIVSANTTANANQTTTSIAAKAKGVTMDVNYPVTKDGKKTTVLIKNVTMIPGDNETEVTLPEFAGYTLKFNVNGDLIDADGDPVGVNLNADGKTLEFGYYPVYVKNGTGSGSSSESNTGSSSSSNNSNSSSNTNSSSSSHATGNTGSNGGSNSNSSNNANSSTSTDKVTTSDTQAAVNDARAKATSTINKAKDVTPTVKAAANSQVNKATTAAGTKAVTDAMTKPTDTKTGDVQTGETHVIRNLVIAMTAAISATALGAFIIKKVSKQK